MNLFDLCALVASVILGISFVCNKHILQHLQRLADDLVDWLRKRSGSLDYSQREFTPGGLREDKLPSPAFEVTLIGVPIAVVMTLFILMYLYPHPSDVPLERVSKIIQSLLIALSKLGPLVLVSLLVLLALYVASATGTLIGRQVVSWLARSSAFIDMMMKSNHAIDRAAFALGFLAVGVETTCQFFKLWAS